VQQTTLPETNPWAAALQRRGWALSADGRAAHKRLQLTDFDAAWAVMQAVAAAAQRLNHHPDWRNVYNVLDITLTTHDAGGLTSLDLALAEVIDAAHPSAAR